MKSGKMFSRSPPSFARLRCVIFLAQKLFVLVRVIFFHIYAIREERRGREISFQTFFFFLARNSWLYRKVFIVFPRHEYGEKCADRGRDLRDSEPSWMQMNMNVVFYGREAEPRTLRHGSGYEYESYEPFDLSIVKNELPSVVSGTATIALYLPTAFPLRAHHTTFVIPPTFSPFQRRPFSYRYSAGTIVHETIWILFST